MIKNEQRAKIRQQVLAMSHQEHHDANRAICTQLASIPSVIAARTIFAYLPLSDEVDLRSLISQWLKETRTVCVPIVHWEQATMQAGQLDSLDETELVGTRHGLKEPRIRRVVPAETIDVMLVPGVGFDASGSRLGRGGGYYDRFLAITRPPIVIGVAFDAQILISIAVEEHDQRMTAVVTPTRILK